ncbi:MAG TPA: hypothetical protein VIC57_11220, partial [Candidatus Dormibacteraeota bacterium]
MTRRQDGRWSRRAAHAALATLVAAALAAPAHVALAAPAVNIDTLAGEPQPLSDLTQTAMQPFGVAVLTVPNCDANTALTRARTAGRRGGAALVAAAVAGIPVCDTLFVADPVNYVVRRVEESEGLFQDVLAGNGGKGAEGNEGLANQAQLSGAYAVAPDADTLEVFIADAFANQVRRVDALGRIHLVAGTGAFGFSGDGGSATSAELASPYGIARSYASAVTYVADTLNNRIRAIDDSGVITTVAGSGVAGFADGAAGAATAGQLNRPRGLAIAHDGTLLIADTGNSAIRRFDPLTRTLSTVVAPAAGLKEPASVAVVTDPASAAFLIADTGNNRIVLDDGPGPLTPVAGTGAAGFSGDGGPALQAQLRAPFAVAVLANGDMVIGDTGNSRVRVVDDGDIDTLAGNGTPSHGTSADQLSGPAAVGLADRLPASICQAAGTGRLLVLDTFNHSLRAQCAAGTSALADVVGTGLPGPLAYPMGMAVAGTDVFVADTFNDVVRRVDLSGATPTVTVVAGTEGVAGFSGDGGPAAAATLSHPQGVAVDRAGNLYIADSSNERIRRVDPAGTITTIAGTGVSGGEGDNGAAADARLFFPAGVAVDTATPANVYVADTFDHRIRRIDGATRVITTIAGSGVEGFQDGPRLTARFDRPWGIAFVQQLAPVGPVLYVADQLNHRVRVVSLAGVGPLQVATLAGTGSRGFLGDGGPATAAEVDGPRGVAAGSPGAVLVADSFNDRVRRIGAGSLALTGIAFGDARTQRQPSDPLTLHRSARVTNPGAGILHIQNVAVAGTGFARGVADSSGDQVDCVLRTTLRPGESCLVGVDFTPPTPSTFTGSVTVTS